jgi:hypothetical protein
VEKLIFNKDKEKTVSEIRRFLKIRTVMILTHKIDSLGNKFSVTGWAVDYKNRKIKNSHVQHFLLKKENENTEFEFLDLPW